jgi:cation diffusion facilitator CzcD-associated flavoprotein CzcO
VPFFLRKYTTPLIPSIEGLEQFEGQVIHSKFYRGPEPFRNKHVVVVGLGPSAVDIGAYVSDAATDVMT